MADDEESTPKARAKQDDADAQAPYRTYEWHGVTRYQCNGCTVDTASERAMIEHQQRTVHTGG